MVTITFGVVFIAALAVVPNQSQSVALGAATVMSLPLAIAFIGDKIQSFKAFGLEVETKAGAESLKRRCRRLVVDWPIFTAGGLPDSR